MTGEIKACPFCGATAERREYDHRHPYEPFGLVAAHSEDCFLNLLRDEEAMYTSWDTRPIEDELAASRDRASRDRASVQRERDEAREMLAEAVEALRTNVDSNKAELASLLNSVCLHDSNGPVRGTAELDSLPDVERLESAIHEGKDFLARYEASK